LTAVLLVTVLTLVACRQTTGVEQAGDTGLEDTQWVLLALRGQPPLAGTAPTATFSQGQVGGSTGCNHYFGVYEVSGAGLSIGELGMTEMYCIAPGVIEQEQAFLTALMEVAGYRLVEGQLELLDAAGDVLLAFEPLLPPPDVALVGVDWELRTFIEGEVASSPLSGTAITLRFFDEGIARGSAGCNDYGGPYTLAGDALSFAGFDITNQGCVDPAGIMEQETRYIDILRRVTRFEIQGDRLTLWTEDGRGLVLAARL